MSPFDTPERTALRETCRAFVTREIVPNMERWERDGAYNTIESVAAR